MPHDATSKGDNLHLYDAVRCVNAPHNMAFAFYAVLAFMLLRMVAAFSFPCTRSG